MSLVLAAAFGLHQLATVVWVGGMFFAHLVLRPAVAEVMQGPDRVRLMAGIFRRFFPWVWTAVALLWGSGLWLLLGVLHGRGGAHVHVMMGIATVMTAIFVGLFAFPYRQFRLAVASGDWPLAAAKLTLIRRLIGVNLVLGLTTAVVGAAGPYVHAG